MGADLDAHFLQPLLAQAACNTQGSGEPTGEMSAACRILEAAVFDLGGVVRMTGPGTVLEIFIVTGTGVLIVNHCGNGGTAGIAVQDACQKFRPVLLLPGCGPVVLTRCPAVEESLQFFQIYGKSRRDAVQGHADGRAVGLTENGEF